LDTDAAGSSAGGDAELDKLADDLSRARAAELRKDPERLAELRHGARLTAIIGVVFALLFALGLALLFSIPHENASKEELIAFYQSDDARLVLMGGLYVLPFAAVAFLWFIASLRSWIRFRADRLSGIYSTVQLLSGAAFITLMLAGAGAISVIPLSRDLAGVDLDVESKRHFAVLARVLLMIFSMRMAAIMVMTTSTIGAQAELFPKWFRLLSAVVAAALFLAASFSGWLVALFPAWVIVLCALILFGSRRLWQATGPDRHDDAP
jgi:hypothetical protein